MRSGPEVSTSSPEGVGELVEPVSRPELPAWPVLALLWGYPLWWATELLPFSAILLAFPMLLLLSLRRNVLLVPGVLPWIGFVVWMLPCAVMLDSLGRLVGFSIRFGQFAAMAVVILYIVNARNALSYRRILAALTAVWVTVILGGYLGILWPEQRLTYTIGLFLPDSVLSNEYVSDLVFPPLAEVQTPWGAAQPFLRPSAPFAYTNGWGAAMAFLTPVVIGAILLCRSRAVTFWGIVGLVAAIPPAVATTNRGLFLTLGVCVSYVFVRLLMRRQWRAFVAGFVASGLALLVLAQLGFLQGIAERQDTVDTTEGRGNLYLEAFERTLLSPVLGYGSPRPSYTSEITVGTQGAIWNAMFCFGFVGLALFLGFLIGTVLRTWSAPGTPMLWIHSALVGTCLMTVFYGLDRQMLFFVVLAALMLRERYAEGSLFWSANTAPVRSM